jgi:hypothetical protein
MPRTRYDGDMDTGVRAVGEAIVRLDAYTALGESPLAGSSFITCALRRRGIEDTPFNRGRVLGRTIREEVERQFRRVESEREGRDVAEWTILYLRAVRGLPLTAIARRLSMPQRSAARYYSHAKELLLDRLLDLDEREHAATLFCPRCGTPVAGRSGVAEECAGCGGQLVLTDDPSAHAGWTVTYRQGTQPVGG